MNTYQEQISTRRNSEQGSSLIEVMVGLLLLAISGLAITMGTSQSIRTMKYVELNHIANSLAISKIEEFASVSGISLTASTEVEAEVLWPDLNISFTRVSTVELNADESRKVTVRVSTNHAPIPTSVEFSTTFAVWE